MSMPTKMSNEWFSETNVIWLTSVSCQRSEAKRWVSNVNDSQWHTIVVINEWTFFFVDCTRIRHSIHGDIGQGEYLHWKSLLWASRSNSRSDARQREQHWESIVNIGDKESNRQSASLQVLLPIRSKNHKFTSDATTNRKSIHSTSEKGKFPQFLLYNLYWEYCNMLQDKQYLYGEGTCCYLKKKRVLYRQSVPYTAWDKPTKHA